MNKNLKEDSLKNKGVEYIRNLIYTNGVEIEKRNLILCQRQVKKFKPKSKPN